MVWARAGTLARPGQGPAGPGPAGTGAWRGWGGGFKVFFDDIYKVDSVILGGQWCIQKKVNSIILGGQWCIQKRLVPLF